jgi:hypothetical protein
MRRLACLLVLVVGCGDDTEDPTTTVAAATQADTTATTAMTDATDATDATSSGGGTTVSTSTTSDPATSSDPSSVSNDPDTGTSAQECDPKMAPFLGEPLPQAAIEIDFAGSTCAAASAAGTAPQIVLDVQMTGLIDATMFGFEVVKASSGQLFEDPPNGDAEVIDLQPDLPITLQLVSVDGGLPVTVSFEVFSQGPTLLDVTADFG